LEFRHTCILHVFGKVVLRRREGKVLNSCNKIGSKARLGYTSNGRSKLIDSMNLSFMNNKIFPDIIFKKIAA